MRSDRSTLNTRIAFLEAENERLRKLANGPGRQCAGCGRVFETDALAEDVCAHCWAAARRVRVHGQASVRMQGEAARFVLEHHLPHSLLYPVQQLLEDAAENALHKMIYTARSEQEQPPLFYKEGDEYRPIAPLDYYPAPGVWLVEWKEHSRSTAHLSRRPVPDPLRLASARRWEAAVLAAIAKRRDAGGITLGESVRLVLDFLAGVEAEEQ